MNHSEFLKQLRQALVRYGVNDIDDITADFSEHFNTGLAMGKTEADIAAELGDPDEIAAQYAGEQPRTAVTGTSSSTAASVPSTGPAASGYRHADQPTASVPPAARTENAVHSGYVYAEDSRGNPRSGAYPGPARPFGSNGSNGPADAYGTAGPSGTYGQPVSGGYVRTESNGQIPAQRADNTGINILLLVLLAIFVTVPAFFAILGVLIGVWAAGFGVGAGSVALFIVAAAEAGVMSVILILFAVALAALSILLFIGAYMLSRLFAVGIGAYVRWNRQVAKGGTFA